MCAMRWRQNLFAIFTAQAPHFLLFDRVNFLLPIWIPKELGPDQMAVLDLHTYITDPNGDPMFKRHGPPVQCNWSIIR
jgi:hypothetical protein